MPLVPDLAADLAAAVTAVGSTGRTLVAVDGPDAAGKTTLADRLAAALTVPVVRASLDGFSAPAAVRRRRGSLSPEGCYRDSCDLRRLEEHLLRPFARGASRVDTAVHDLASDRPAVVSTGLLPPDAVLVLDGVFLLRPELRSWWHLAVHLHVSEEVTLARALRRDVALFGPRRARCRGPVPDPPSRARPGPAATGPLRAHSAAITAP